MPAVTTRLEMTKQDMRKGRKTGSPVSGVGDVSSFNGSPNHHSTCRRDELTWMERRVHNLLRLP